MEIIKVDDVKAMVGKDRMKTEILGLINSGHLKVLIVPDKKSGKWKNADVKLK